MSEQIENQTETTVKRPNRGGRKPSPQPPANSSECLHLLSVETVRQNPSARRLQQLRSLNRLFVAAEKAACDENKTRATQEANRLKQAELDHRKADYLLRFLKSSPGIQATIKQISSLKARVQELEVALAGKNTEVA